MISMLSEISLSRKGEYGTKASALGELIKHEEEVPMGFALSSEFFIKFIHYNNIDLSNESYLVYNEKSYDAILNGKFSSEMEQMIFKFLKRIDWENEDGKYVVRSSALCEDSENYSMAGMFASFINLSSFEEVKESIKKCYASLFSDKVVDYFISNDLGFEDLKMGAVIQRFIEGEYSGVNFSVDTIDMDEEIMHINIVNGICDDYVSGKTSSAFYKINKKTKEIMEEKIPENFISISKDTFLKLFEKTLKIEEIFLKHQDIEWTIKGDEIYILQSRPITTFKIKGFEPKWIDEEESSYVWYRESDKPYEPLINELSLIQGDALNKGFYAVGGFQDLYSGYCVQNGHFFYRNKEMKNREEQEKNFLDLISRLHGQYKNIFQDVKLPILIKFKSELDKYISKDLSDKETVIFLEKSIEYMEFLSFNHAAVTHGCDYLDEFMEYCKVVYNDFNVDEFYDLVFNVSILNKEREFYIQMADEVNSNKTLKEVFHKCHYDTLLYFKLKHIDESKNLFRLMDSYIKEFGICNLDRDVNSPYIETLLMEDYYKIIGNLRGFLNINLKEFRASLENSFKNKEVIKINILNKLDDENKMEFLNKLRLAEKSYLARDDHHYYFERMTKSYLRLALEECKKNLVKKGIIQKGEDIYFLVISEIKEGLINSYDFKNIVDKRKETFNYQNKLFVPPTIGIEEDESTQNLIDQNISSANLVLKGTSGLRKCVNGRVKIGIPSFLDEESILVLPFTRCGDILPVISYVKGIIVEIGSPFEHIGILAREMNIPVIYNVKDAMKILKDGDMVKVDGFMGEVKVYK